MKSAVETLNQFFRARVQANPRYSLRAYARFVGLSPSHLSAVLSGKRALSVEKAFEIGKKLGLSSRQLDAFCKAVRDGREPSELKAITEREYVSIAQDRFALISDWHHFAILELSFCRGTRLTPAGVAKRLGIPQGQAREALDRLRRMGLLVPHEGHLRKAHPQIATETDVPSQAIRNHHRQLIEKALRALEQRPVGERDVTGMTLSFKASDLEAAKEEIRRFRRRMALLFSEKDADSVFQLNVQFFELTSH